MWTWIAAYRNRNKVIDFEVGSRHFSTYLRMAFRLINQYKIKHLCTDGYDVYSKFKISQFHHKTKAETCLVESKNSLTRHYLARFNRRTKRYSKSQDMIIASLRLLFNKLNYDVYC